MCDGVSQDLLPDLVLIPLYVLAFRLRALWELQLPRACTRRPNSICVPPPPTTGCTLRLLRLAAVLHIRMIISPFISRTYVHFLLKFPIILPPAPMLAILACKYPDSLNTPQCVTFPSNSEHLYLYPKKKRLWRRCILPFSPMTDCSSYLYLHVSCGYIPIFLQRKG